MESSPYLKKILGKTKNFKKMGKETALIKSRKAWELFYIWGGC